MSTLPNTQIADKHKGVGGWLLLLCLALTVFSPLSTLYNFVSGYSAAQPHFTQVPSLELMFSLDLLLSIGLTTLSVYAGVSLWAVRPGAVKTVKNFFGALIGYCLLMVILPMLVGLPAYVAGAISGAALVGVIRALIFVAIWNTYLNRSERVKATYEMPEIRTLPPPPSITQVAQPFMERDNLGTRQDSFEAAVSYWMGERLYRERKDPFTLYTFDTAEDARSALLALPCIHVAADSQKLICTEPLVFGYYEVEGKYEAILCGDDLTRELWERAKSSFSKHGGRLKNELEPTKDSELKVNPPRPEEVVFMQEEHQQRDGVGRTYRLHKGPDAESAKEFLKRNPVSGPHFYVVVETPEGNYGRDVNGIYKE